MDPIKPGNHPIHPIGPYHYSDVGFDIEVQRHGLTKREYFAAPAMQGIAASYPQWVQPEDAGRLAECAVAAADALLAELAKEPPK